MLVAEDELLVLTDAEGLVLILKQKVEFRRFMTDRLRAALQPAALSLPPRAQRPMHKIACGQDSRLPRAYLDARS